MEWFAQLQPIPASSAPQPDHQELFPSVPEADTSQHDLHAVVDSLQEQATVHNLFDGRKSAHLNGLFLF